MHSESPTTAYFDMLYMNPVPSVLTRPAPDAVFTMWPSPRSTMRGTIVWMPLTTPPLLTPSTQSHISYVIWVTDAPPPTPALLHRIEMGPTVASTSSTT